MKTNKAFQLNIPISKIDEEQRIVVGIATDETLDSQGDIVDYEASKKAFSEWKGNIREMHGDTAIGKAIDVQFDDEAKSVTVSAKISESADGENAWIKVKEEILSGFSIGGRVFEVAKDKAVKGANRIMDYALSELSLVDNPANPSAELLMVKSADGGLQRVEEDKSEQLMPTSWWATKFMGAPMQKSVYDAQEALGVAAQLTWLIMTENAEGEADQVADLVNAFNALRDFAAKEVAEGDDFDWAKEYAEVIELAQNAINLRKGKQMADKKVEKTNVVGGEERDLEAKATQTQEEAGRPVNDTTERAAEAGVPPKGTEEEITVKTEGEENTEEAEKTEAIKEKGDESTEETAAEEEAKTKPEDEKKSDTATDLLKNVETLLTKLNDERGTTELKKVTDAIKSDIGKVMEKQSSLEDRISKLEEQPMPTKGQRYQVIGKGDDASEVDAEVKTLLKRQEELIANPHDAKPGEMAELAMKLRKANIGEKITVN